MKSVHLKLSYRKKVVGYFKTPFAPSKVSFSHILNIIGWYLVLWFIYYPSSVVTVDAVCNIKIIDWSKRILRRSKQRSSRDGATIINLLCIPTYNEPQYIN